MSFRCVRKVISIIIITIFFFSNINISYASPSSKSLFKNKKIDYDKISSESQDTLQKKQSILKGEDSKEVQSQQKEAKKILSSHLEDISQIHIPQELGRIVEVHQGTRDGFQETAPLIVGIQDLHTNPEAELNLAKILELLLKDYNMGLVCSEGAIGKIDTSSISNVPDSSVKEKVSRIFIDSGELTGEEYLSITKYPELPIWGIETKAIYFDNIIGFNKIMKFNPDSQSFISQVKKAITELKPKLYSKDLLDLGKKESDFSSQKLDTAKYIEYLSSFTKKLNISMSNYKNISLLIETMEKEKLIDQLKIMKDSQNLLLSLQFTLTSKSLKNDLDSLMARAALFKDQKISPFSFYGYLKDLANKHLKEEFATKYPALNSFVDYLTKVNSLDSTKLFTELEDLNFAIKESLSETDEQKILVKADHNINFLENFFNLKVSNEDLDYYIDNKESHKVAFFKDFLPKTLKKYNINIFVDYNPALIDNHLQELEDFYKVVKDRDVAMVANSLSEITKRGVKLAALVHGGFHTKGITNLLKEKNYSYIIISPYSKTDINEENYHFLLSGRRKPIEELLKQLDLPGIVKKFTKTLRLPLVFDSALVNAWNATVAPEVAKIWNVPVDQVELTIITRRLAPVLAVAMTTKTKPLGRIAKSSINPETIIVEVTYEEGQPEYFQLAVAGIPKKVTKADFEAGTMVAAAENIEEVPEGTIATLKSDGAKEKGSALKALETLADIRGYLNANVITKEEYDDYLQNGSMSRSTFIKIRKAAGQKVKEAGWSERTADREIADLKRLGIVEEKQVNGKYVFKIKFTPEQIAALPEGITLDLNRGAIDNLPLERIAEISEALRVATKGATLLTEGGTLQPILDRLKDEEAITKLDNVVYGKPFEGVEALSPQWAKAGFDKADKKEPSRFGWTLENLRWISRNPGKIQQVLDDASEIRAKYRYVIFCGMGGSGLSVQTVKTTFGEPENLTIYSLRTTDPAVIKDILENIAKKEGSLEAALRFTLVIPISKSGKTEETVSHKRYFENLFNSFAIDIRDHMWVVTDIGSPMDTGDYTQREIQLNSKGDIGGRFTAPTTNIFLLPLALVAPEKVKVILERARAMNEIGNIDNDTFIRLGAYLYHMAAEAGKDKVTFMVPRELQDLPMWSEQLVEESLGKGGKGVTIFYGEDISEVSLRDVEKNDRVFLRINIGGKKTNDELWKRLEKSGYPVFEINVEDIDSIGGIMLGLQRAVATIGYLWDICFVDQPAVEGYKNATREVMSKLQPGQRVEVPHDWENASFGKLKLYYDRLIQVGAITEKELEIEVQRLGATMNDAAAVYAAIINILKTKHGFEAKELTSYGRMTEGMKSILQRVRTDIFTNGLKMPSKFGEGPDKNHSYHQNIEAGKDMWLSTYFMPLQIEQPETLPYDDNLIRAQTIGTVNSIVNKGRKVVLITFDSTTKDAEGDVESFFKEVERYLEVSTLSQSPKSQETKEMDQIIAIQAEAVKNNRAGFEKWIETLPADNVVVIIAMDEGEHAAVQQYEGYRDKVYVKTLKDLNIDEEGKFNLIELFGVYGAPDNFNGFKLGTPAAIEKYKSVIGTIAQGV